jgi:hypothetical protein
MGQCNSDRHRTIAAIPSTTIYKVMDSTMLSD